MESSEVDVQLLLQNIEKLCENVISTVEDGCSSGGWMSENVEFHYNDVEGIGRILSENPGLLEYPDEVLAMALMFAKQPGGKNLCAWSLHCSTLPSKLNTTLFWSDEELQELRDCNIFHLTRMMKNQIDNDWVNLHEPLTRQYPDILGACTLDSYKWALSIVYSRAVGITKQGKYIRLIPPLLDMANHSPYAGREAADTLGFDEKSGKLVIINTAVRQPGEEIFVLYGPYCNAKLAYSYGFVAVESPHRAVDLWTRVSPSTAHAVQKQELLQAHTLTQNQTYEFVGTIRDCYISPALLATIRVIQATAEELEEGIERAFVGQMVSVRNETAVYTSLRQLLLARMKIETAESDRQELGEMLLSNTPLSNRRLMALVIRVEEREVMQECVALVDGFVAELAVEAEDFLPPDSPHRASSGSNDKVGGRASAVVESQITDGPDITSAPVEDA